MEFWAGSRDAGTLRSARPKPLAAIGTARLRILPPPRLQTDPDGDFNFTRTAWMQQNWTAGLGREGDRRGWNDCCRRYLEERGLERKDLAEKVAAAGLRTPA